MRWRPTLVVLHRDVGFLCVGFVLAYAVSGIAVNHAHHWDYNRSVEVIERGVGKPGQIIPGLAPERARAIDADPKQMTRAEEAQLFEALVRVSGRQQPPRNHFWRGPDNVSLFFGSGNSDTLEYTISSGTIVETKRSDRWLLRDLNFLHLNEARGIWTYVADAFAALLVFLAVSGAVMVKGKRGLRGRGGLLLAIGLSVPVVAAVVFRYL